jgi:putrescine aminotransferase
VGGDGEFAHGFTYSGHPACAAVALANIALMEKENLIARAKKEIGPYFQKRFCELQSHPLVGEARAIGMLGALELVADKQTAKRFDPPGRAGIICRDFCIECGVVLRAVRDTIVASPPLIISQAQVDELCEKAKTALDKTAAALRA